MLDREGGGGVGGGQFGTIFVLIKDTNCCFFYKPTIVLEHRNVSGIQTIDSFFFFLQGPTLTSFLLFRPVVIISKIVEREGKFLNWYRYGNHCGGTISI